MKLIFRIFICLTLFSGVTFGQSVHRCGTAEKYEELMKNNPAAKQGRQEFYDRVATWNSANNSKTTAGTVNTIGVVVHVVYKNTAQNISDNQILAQIDVLNKDYRRQNTDASNTPAAFQPVAADCEIEFHLVNKDPSGNPTTGITRTFTNLVSPGSSDSIYHTALGGEDIWDRSCYLNIWVCQIGNATSVTTLGYTYLPGTMTPDKDGVVIDFRAFGVGGSAQSSFNIGRTTTHEIGHFFNLLHIWGDAAGCTANDDSISDTPLQSIDTQGCPAGVVTDMAGCSPSAPGIMYQNYMDYTEDACMNLFTQGQKTRMKAALSVAPRYTMDTCQVIGITETSSGKSAEIFPNPTGGKFTIQNVQFPVLTLDIYNLLGEKVYSMDGIKQNQSTFTA